jgi:imidazolonepropionase-like amidohydrolase
MRGFTTARDVGGPVFGLKSAIDSGVIAGPRIYPSGALVTVTSGHGDFRQLSELSRTIGGTLSRWLSLQPLPEELREGFPVGSVQRAKADEVWPGIARTYELAKKYKIKTAWGTDVLFS